MIRRLGLSRRLLRHVAPGDAIYRRSLASDVLSAGALGAVGDVICQVGAEGVAWKDIDRRRVAALTVFSSVYIGMFCHHLYKLYPVGVSVVAGAWKGAPRARHLRFHTRAVRLAQEETAAGGFGCALLDNAHCGAIYTPAYFLGVGLLQGDALATATANLRQEWWTAYVGCTGFWLPFMWFNFRFVPSARRVQAMASANLVWSVVMDYLAHRSSSHGEEVA